MDKKNNRKINIIEKRIKLTKKKILAKKKKKKSLKKWRNTITHKEEHWIIVQHFINILLLLESCGGQWCSTMTCDEDKDESWVCF